MPETLGYVFAAAIKAGVLNWKGQISPLQQPLRQSKDLWPNIQLQSWRQNKCSCNLCLVLVLVEIAFVIHELNFYLSCERTGPHNICCFSHTKLLSGKKKPKNIKLPFTFQITVCLEKQNYFYSPLISVRSHIFIPLSL